MIEHKLQADIMTYTPKGEAKKGKKPANRNFLYIQIEDKYVDDLKEKGFPVQDYNEGSYLNIEVQKKSKVEHEKLTPDYTGTFTLVLKGKHRVLLKSAKLETLL